MKIFGLIGWSGSGKTSLVVRLIPAFIARGYRVSTMKHTHHHFDMDTPGKDSWNHREAGASEVMVCASSRWALLHEYRDAPESSMETMIAKMMPVDLLLIEGFKSYGHPKLEVHRPSLGKPLLAVDNESIMAVASNESVTHLLQGEREIPVLNLDNTEIIADFIEHTVQLTPAVSDQ